MPGPGIWGCLEELWAEEMSLDLYVRSSPIPGGAWCSSLGRHSQHSAGPTDLGLCVLCFQNWACAPPDPLPATLSPTMFTADLDAP